MSRLPFAVLLRKPMSPRCSRCSAAKSGSYAGSITSHSVRSRAKPTATSLRVLASISGLPTS